MKKFKAKVYLITQLCNLIGCSDGGLPKAMDLFPGIVTPELIKSSCEAFSSAGMNTKAVKRGTLTEEQYHLQILNTLPQVMQHAIQRIHSNDVAHADSQVGTLEPLPIHDGETYHIGVVHDLYSEPAPLLAKMGGPKNITCFFGSMSFGEARYPGDIRPKFKELCAIINSTKALTSSPYHTVVLFCHRDQCVELGKAMIECGSNNPDWYNWQKPNKFAVPGHFIDVNFEVARVGYFSKADSSTRDPRCFSASGRGNTTKQGSFALAGLKRYTSWNSLGHETKTGVINATEMNVAVPYKILLNHMNMHAGEWACDLFCGSGSCTIAALCHNVSVISIDCRPDQVEATTCRVNKFCEAYQSTQPNFYIGQFMYSEPDPDDPKDDCEEGAIKRSQKFLKMVHKAEVPSGGINLDVDTDGQSNVKFYEAGFAAGKKAAADAAAASAAGAAAAVAAAAPAATAVEDSDKVEDSEKVEDAAGKKAASASAAASAAAAAAAAAAATAVKDKVKGSDKVEDAAGKKAAADATAAAAAAVSKVAGEAAKASAPDAGPAAAVDDSKGALEIPEIDPHWLPSAEAIEAIENAEKQAVTSKDQQDKMATIEEDGSGAKGVDDKAAGEVLKDGDGKDGKGNDQVLKGGKDGKDGKVGKDGKEGKEGKEGSKDNKAANRKDQKRNRSPSKSPTGRSSRSKKAARK
jgi:hypothetical protein